MNETKPVIEQKKDVESSGCKNGISRRDLFAAATLFKMVELYPNWPVKRVCEAAYQYADAMLEFGGDR